MTSRNKLTLNILIHKALLQYFCDPDFYSDLVKVKHNCFHKRFVQSKKYSNYAKEMFPYQAGTKEGMGVTMTHLVVIVKCRERNKLPDFGN